MTRGRERTTPNDHQAAHDRLEDRITKRVDDSIDALSERSEASFQVVIEGMGSLQADLRRGQLDRQTILSRLGELETQIGENRDATNLLRDRVAHVEAGSKDVTKEAVLEAAPEAAVSATRAAPREVWSSLTSLQKTVAIVAGCVAILAGLSGALTGLERIAKAGWAGIATAWSHAKADEATKAD